MPTNISRWLVMEVDQPPIALNSPRRYWEMESLGNLSGKCLIREVGILNHSNTNEFLDRKRHGPGRTLGFIYYIWVVDSTRERCDRRGRLSHGVPRQYSTFEVSEIPIHESSTFPMGFTALFQSLHRENRARVSPRPFDSAAPFIIECTINASDTVLGRYGELGYLSFTRLGRCSDRERSSRLCALPRNPPIGLVAKYCLTALGASKRTKCSGYGEFNQNLRRSKSLRQNQ
jgi:hypothetical protein